MKPLDELREDIREIGREASDHWRPGDDAISMEYVLEAISVFEAEHPGLVDLTDRCSFCGKPLPHEDGQVDWEKVPVLAYDDGAPMYGCPECAKDGEA